MNFFKTLFILWGISAAGNISHAEKELQEEDKEFAYIDELIAEHERMKLAAIERSKTQEINNRKTESIMEEVRLLMPFLEQKVREEEENLSRTEVI